MNTKLRNLTRLAAALAAALGLTGCIKNKTLVIVNPDGSGQIVTTTVFAPQAAAEMAQSGRSSTDDDGKPKDPFYDEEALRKAADQFGSDVEFIRGRKIDQDGLKGHAAVYSFKDINHVSLPFVQNTWMPDMGSKDDAGKPVEFTFVKGTPNKLTVRLPEREKPEPAAAAEPDADNADANSEDREMQMARGLEINLAIQVKGTVVRSNASRPAADRKDRFTLVDLNLNRLMDSPTQKGQLTGMMTGLNGPDEAIQRFLALPGATVETNREVTVEFQ